ncbi:MAG: DNA-processing protein DprA [Candidatus Taylorbacteria bacterium]|nr:DNA-processing protein DprA [Candidatus Taylorbacteria bacterium]
MKNENTYTISGDEIPFQLTQIPQPPIRLFVQGNLPKENSKILCVVGARKYSSYGEEVTKKLISGLRGYNICIVSGLAHGIDSLAHRVALDNDIQTIAFPGSGLDRKVLYPKKHHRLADEILYAGGGLISEYEMTFPSQDWTFPQRNRLMVGISHAVLLIEAREKSGSQITARLAMDYNRDLGVVPGQITVPLSDVPNYYLKQGAHPITSRTDILHMLGFNIDSSQPIQKELFDNLSDIEKMIVEFLQIEPLTSDLLAVKTYLNINNLNEILSSMEINGIIKERNGRFSLF